MRRFKLFVIGAVLFANAGCQFVVNDKVWTCFEQSTGSWFCDSSDV
jgi:hypothetical protein